MLRPLLSGLLVVIALGAPVCAQSATEDAEFARGLASFGYFELAEEVVQSRIGAANPEERLDLQLVVADIRAEQGRREKDPAARVEKLVEAARTYDAFVKEHPTSPRASELRYQVTDLYRVAGEFAVAAVKAQSDAAKREKLRETGLEIFSKAIMLAEGRLTELKAMTGRSEREDNEFVALKFAVAKLYYSQASIYDNLTGTAAQLSLQQATQQFEDFEIEHSDSLLAFEARRILGLMAQDQGKLDDALDYFTSSCDTLSVALDGDPGLAQDEAVRDVVSTAYLEKARFLLGPKKSAAAAIQTLEELRTKLPTVEMSKDGRQALLTLGEAYVLEGGTDKAKTLFTRLVNLDPASATGVRARELLDKMGGAGAGGLGKALEGAVTQRDIGRAEKLCGRILAAARKGVAAEEDDPAEALFQLGQLYFETGRPWDAAACFRAVADDFSKHKRASAAKFNEAISYAQCFGIDKGKIWKELNKETRDDILKKFPNSEEAKDVAYVVAQDAENDGRDDEAVDLYLKVPTSSAKYGEAQWRAGRILLVLGQAAAARNQNDIAKDRYEKSVKALQTAHDRLVSDAGKIINPAEKQRLLNMAFNSRMMEAGLQLQSMVKKPEKCLAILEENEKVVAATKDEDDPDKRKKISNIWDLRIKAYVQMNKGREAGELLEKYIAENRGSGAGAEAALSVASAMDAEAVELSKNKKEKEAADLWKEAGNWYARTIQEAKKGGASKIPMEKVGARLIDLALRNQGLAEDLPLFAISPDIKLDKQGKEAIEAAGSALQAAAQAGSSQTLNIERQRQIARSAALAGRWTDALEALDKIVQANPLFDKDNKLIAEATKKVPDLPAIYEDVAVASVRVGELKKTDPYYFDTAMKYLGLLANNAERNGKLYWECRYLYLVALKGANKLADLKLAIESLDRAAPDADGGKYGIKQRIEELKKKIPDIRTK